MFDIVSEELRVVTVRIQRFVPKNRPKLLLQNTEKFDNFLTTTRKCTKVCNARARRAEPLYRSLNLGKRRSGLRNSALTFNTGLRPEKFKNAASDFYC